RFAAATLIHRRREVAGVLAALLVPWTAALVLADPRWFPTRRVQLGWAIFDVGVVVGLVALSRRWRERLARALFGLVAADAVLTAVQAALWNLPRRRSIGDVLVIAVSLVAPVFAAWFLGRASFARRADRLKPPRE